MLYEITHVTRYRYSQPVFIEPLVVMLRPRSDASQTVRDYRIKFTPEPAGLSRCTGLEGNNSETAWFSGLHKELLIEVHTQVETHHDDTFNFFITDSAALKLPLKYAPYLMDELAHYLARDEEDAGVSAFTAQILSDANYETIPFLTQLTWAIPKRLEYLLREHGDPWAPGITLSKGEGSCRDFSMLFIDMCRSVGLAARFVSGYCFGDEAAESFMHAWAEVYLPGAGWRGFDPSRGLLTGDDYISVAAARTPKHAAPTTGSFRGDASAELSAEISIRQV